jgi:myosin heavy subunit
MTKGCITAAHTDDAKDFAEMRKAMEALKIDAASQGAMLRALATVLHLGDLSFQPKTIPGQARGFVFVLV